MIFRRRPKVSLVSIDEIYKQAIVSLSDDVRIDYCERLIERCVFEKRYKKNDAKYLKCLLKAAKNELDKLKK